MNPKVDRFLVKAKKWREETEKLREILLGFPLTEEMKWGKPCYTFKGSNLIIVQGFKNYCALMFCKGALLKDSNGLLTAPGQHTQAARQIRFSQLREIVEMEPVLNAYINEAIQAEQAGRKVNFKKNPEPAPTELQAKLDQIPSFKKAFNALTPGRQRGYILYFSGAKQSATRKSRVEKCVPLILEGKGLND